VEGIKRGTLPYYATTSSFPPPAIMILQTMVGFSYFNFFVNMLKCQYEGLDRILMHLSFGSLLKLIIMFW